MRSRWSPSGGGPHAITLGLTDLMTSLAIVFVLLLVVFTNPSRSAEEQQGRPRPDPAVEPIRALAQWAAPYGLTLETEPGSPEVLRVVIPDSLLNFEWGQSALSAAGHKFLGEFMPLYALTLCGARRADVAGVVIEGHTDDSGGDAFNLKLSQERSFRVLVRSLEAIGAASPAAHACFSQLASASGRGKQDLVRDGEGRPDNERSRRVVLKILIRSALARGAAAPG